MQNFHCQFGKNQAFDPYGKRFALESRLIFQNRQETLPENLRSRAEKVSEHEITSDKMREAVIVQVRSLCMGAIRESREDVKTNPNGTQNVNIYDETYTLNNKALLELDAKHLPSNGEFLKSKMWADIVKALPGIDQAEGAIINLMDLYKVTPSPDLNLIPKDTMWMRILKEGLEEKDRASLQELEDLWSDTKDTARDRLDELKTEIEGGTRKAAEVHADEQVATAIESGKITTEQIEKLSKLSKKYSVEETRFDKWNDNDPDSKKRKLEESNIHSLLSVEDIKATKFIVEYTEGLIGKPAVFEVTQEEIEMYKKTVEFAGKKSGFNQQEILNLQNKMTEHNFGLLETPAYIEHIKAIVSSLPNIRSFAAASHVYRAILQDIESEKISSYKAFYDEFYNSRDGSLEKKSSQGVGKYISALGLKGALTKQEYDNVFLICQPALAIQYSTWFDREQREKEIASRESKTVEEGLTVSEIGTITDERMESESPEDRSARERKEEEDRRLEEERRQVEEARSTREETERMERETADAALREKTEKVASVRTAIESYLATVDPSSTKFEDLKKWSDLQGDVTDESIEEVGKTDTFRELKNKYIGKIVRIFARDLQALDKADFIKKVRDERIFVESEAKVVQIPLSEPQMIPAKSIYKPENVFLVCLKQIGLGNEQSYYSVIGKNFRTDLLSPITNLFALFETEDENKDITPEAITDEMFAQFKSGGVAIATRETTAERAGETEVAVEESKEDPFDDLDKDEEFKQARGQGATYAAVGSMSQAIPKYEAALSRVETNYDLGPEGNKEGVIDKYVDAGIEYMGHLYKSIAHKSDVERFKNVWERISKMQDYTSHAGRLKRLRSSVDEIHEVKLTGFGSGRGKVQEIGLATLIEDPDKRRIFSRIEDNAIADNANNERGQEPSTYFLEGTYTFGNVDIEFTPDKIIIGKSEFPLEKGKKIEFGHGKDRKQVLEIINVGTLPNGKTHLTYKLNDQSITTQIQQGETKKVTAKGDIEIKIPPSSGEINVKKLAEETKALGKLVITDITEGEAIAEAQPTRLFEQDRTYQRKKQQADAQFALFKENIDFSITIPADNALGATKDLRKHIETLPTKGFELIGDNNNVLAETLRRQAEIEYYLGDFDSAKKTIEEALGRNASNPEAIRRLAEEIGKPVKVKIDGRSLTLANTFDPSTKEGAIMHRMQARVNEGKTEYAYLPEKKYRVGRIELKLTADGIMVNGQLHRITTSQILIERDGELTKNKSSIILQINEVRMEGGKIVSAEITVFSGGEQTGRPFTYKAGAPIETYNGVDLEISGDSGIGSLRQIGSPLVFNSEEDGALDLVELEKQVGKVVIENSGDRVNIVREDAVAVAEEPAVGPVTEHIEPAAPETDQDGLPNDPNALPGFIVTTRDLFAGTGKIADAKNIAEKLEKKFPDMQGEAALCFASLCMAIADGLYKNISNAEPMSYEEFKEKVGSALLYFDKANAYYMEKAGDATHDKVSQAGLVTNLYGHILRQVQAVKISGTDKYEMVRNTGRILDPVTKKFSSKIDDTVSEINNSRRKPKFKREHIDSDGNLTVYLLAGDKINGVEVNDTTTALALADIERDRLAVVATEEQRAAEEAARIAEAARREEERVAEEARQAEAQRLAELEAARQAEAETATAAEAVIPPEETVTELQPEASTEEQENIRLADLSKQLKKEIDEIDTLPEIAELMYETNPKKGFSKKDRLDLKGDKALYLAGERLFANIRDIDEIYGRADERDSKFQPEAKSALESGARLSVLINSYLDNKEKTLALSIMKQLVDAVEKNLWQKQGEIESSEWWQFRAYMYRVAEKDFKHDIEKTPLPFDAQELEEIHAWFRKKVGEGPALLAEEKSDEVGVRQNALLEKLPKLQTDGTLIPAPSIIDIAAIYGKETKLLGDEDRIIRHYSGEEVDWMHYETPERIKNSDAIARALKAIEKYGDKLVADKKGAIAEISSRLEHKDDPAMYPNVESFTNIDGLAPEEKRLLGMEFKFDEETFAKETTHWLQLIISEDEIDAALEVEGANANEELKKLPTDVDLIARQLIEAQVQEGVAIPPGMLVATIELMRGRLLADDGQSFREKVFTNVDRDTEGSSLSAKYNRLKESLRVEEARLVLDEVFKEYRNLYPLQKTDPVDFKSGTMGRLAFRGITPTDGNSSTELWDTAIAKAHRELTDPAMKNLQASLDADAEMEKAVKDALEEISPIPDTQSFDEFLSKIAETNEDAQKFLAYYTDPEKSAESVSSKTYELLSTIYSKVWRSAIDEVRLERESSEGAEKEQALRAKLIELPDQAAAESRRLTKANPEIKKTDLLEKVKLALQKAVPSRDKFKAGKDALIAEQIAKTDSKTHTAIIEKAFETKIAYLTDEEKKTEVDPILKNTAGFSQILDAYHLSEFVSQSKTDGEPINHDQLRKNYETLAVRFIKVAIDGMLGGIKAFEISPDNNAIRKPWVGRNNEYDVQKFLPYYFDIMKAEEFTAKLLTDKKITDSADRQLKADEYVKTALLFDVAVGEQMQTRVARADTDLIGKWIYPDKAKELRESPTETQLKNILAPHRYLLYVRTEIFNDKRPLFHDIVDKDKENEEKAVVEFLFANLDRNKLGRTMEEVATYPVVPIEALKTAARGILATNIFMDAKELEKKLIEQFENQPEASEQRIAINSTEGDTSDEGKRFRQLALVAFEEKFKHLKSEDTTKKQFTLSSDLRQSWLDIYTAYNLDKFSPKSFAIFEGSTHGRKHIDMADPLDKALGKLMTDAVMHYAETYLKEALQDVTLPGVKFREAFAKTQDGYNIEYTEKEFFRAISEAQIPDGTGEVHESINYITHFLENFADFQFETRVARAIEPEVKALDTAYVYSADMATVTQWNVENPNPKQPAKNFIEWIGERSGQTMPKRIEPDVLSAIAKRLESTLNEEPLPPEVVAVLEKENEWVSEVAPEEILLKKVPEIVLSYMSRNDTAPSPNELLTILKQKGNFPLNEIPKNSEKYFKVVDTAMRVIMDSAKADTEVTSWEQLTEKYKLNDYIPELGKMDRIRDFANDWIKPLDSEDENPNLKKTFADFISDMGINGGLRDIYPYSKLVIEEAVNNIILPAIKQAQDDAVQKAEKTHGRGRDAAIQTAKESYHPETFREFGENYISDVSGKFYKEIVDANLAGEMAARHALMAAKSLKQDMSEGITLAIDSELRRPYFDFENQKYDASKFFAHFVEKESGIPEELRRDPAHFTLPDEQKTKIQTALDSKKEMIFIDTAVRIATKDKGESSTPGDLFARITNPVEVMRSKWVDEDSNIDIDKFLTWIFEDPLNLIATEVTRTELGGEVKKSLEKLILKHWLSELNDILDPVARMKIKVWIEAEKDAVVKEWAYLPATQEIATFNEFTKTDLLPLTKKEGLSVDGKQLVESFIAFISNDKNFERKFLESEKIELGIFLRARDYTNYITANEEEFLRLKDKVESALITQGLDACSYFDDAWERGEAPKKKVAPLTTTETLEKEKLEVQLRIIPHNREKAPDHATLGILRDTTGIAEDQRNFYYKDLVSGIIYSEGTSDELTQDPLTRFYKDNPENPAVVYFNSERVENPDSNETFQKLKKEVEKIEDTGIQTIAQNELQTLEELMKKPDKTSDEVRSMHTLKDNIESLQYIDETINRIIDTTTKVAYRTEIMSTLNRTELGELAKRIASTEIKIPDFDQLLTLLENTWGYSEKGLLRTSEDVLTLEEDFETAFRQQTEGGEMLTVNIEHRKSLKKTLEGEGTTPGLAKEIADRADITEEITSLVNQFAEGSQDTVESLIHTYLIQHTIDQLTDGQITEMKREEDGSFLNYLEYVGDLSGMDEDTLRTVITESLVDGNLQTEYSKIFPGEAFRTREELQDIFYGKPGKPADLADDRRYREWLDATPEIMESNEFMTELDLFIRDGITLRTEDADLNPVIDHYKQMKKYESVFGDNEYSFEIAGKLDGLTENGLRMEGTEKQTYDALTEDPEKFAYLLRIYGENVRDGVDELRQEQRDELEALRKERETVERPHYGTIFEKAHLDKDKKDTYEITKLEPEALAALPRQERLKYILQLYHNSRLNDLPTKDELAEEESLYEKAQEIHNAMEKFTLEDISKAIAEKGLKLHMKWSMIEVNGMPLKNFMPDSPFLADAVLLYMDGNKETESVEKKNGFFYTYLRDTYKPKKDKAALLALTPDKLADDLVKACEIYREHLDNHYNVAERLKEYQEEILGEESVTETLAKIEEEKEREKQAELHERAANITDTRQRDLAERLASSPRDAEAAEAFIGAAIKKQEEVDTEDAGERVEPAPETTHEHTERTADAEVKAMFEKIDTFMKKEIADEDVNAPLLRAAKEVIRDLLIATERENQIENPLSASKLGQVLDARNLRIATHLIDTITNGNLNDIAPEIFDQMLMALLERDDAFREISARDRENLGHLREEWLSAKEQEPQKITTDLLREMLLKLPSTKNGIEQISAETMRQWYNLEGGELVFREQAGAYKTTALILQSFGFRVTASDLEIADEDTTLEPFITEVMTARIVPILNSYHRREDALGDQDKDGLPDRNYTLQEPHKSALIDLPEPESQTWQDEESATKFIALKTEFFEAINGVKGKKDTASTLPHYREVLQYLAGKDATDTTNPNHPMSRLFYEVLLTMSAPEKAKGPAKREMTIRERAIDTERTRLAEEVAMQGSLLEQMYREEVLADAKLTIDKADGTYLKDSKVDFSNLQHLSRNVFSEKFRYHVKGGEFLTSEEAQTAYGTALDLLESSRAASHDIVGFGDFALHKFYKNTPGIDFPIQAKEKFFKDYKDIKDALRMIAEHSTGDLDEEGFQGEYKNEDWYKKEYKPLAKRVARIIRDQMVQDGVLEKKERRTLKYLEEKLLRGEAPASLMMMETEMESYMVSSTKILRVLEDINEEIAINNILEGSAQSMDIARLHEITGYAKLRPELKTGLPPKVSIEKYLERLHLLQTQKDIYEWYFKMDEETQRNMYEWYLDEETGEIHEKGFEKWKTESYGKTVKETLQWFGQALPTATAEGLPEFLQNILRKYEAGHSEILLAAHKDWSKEEIRQARRFDALHEDITASTELGKPETYTDKRFGDGFERTRGNLDLQFTDIKKASGPYSEHDIAFNYGLTAENSHLQSIDAIYVSDRMRDDFVDAIKNLDIRPPLKKRKMIDTFKNNPDDIAKLFYAVLGKEKARKTEGFWKPHFSDDGAIWPVMDIPKSEIDDFVKENEEIIKDLKWEPPTLRQVIEAKGTPGFAEFFERGITLEHLVFDQSSAALQQLQASENPLDDLMEYTLRIHEIGSRGKAIDRPNRAELEEKAKEHYTDLYELYVNRDSAWEQYESRTFVMREDPEEKEKAETKLKTEMADTLLRDGITTLSFMYEYPVTWGKKYDKFVDVDTLHNLHEALNILLGREDESIDEEESTLEKLMKIRDEKGEIFSKKNLERIKKLSPRHIEAIATTLQFGKIYGKAIEQGIARKEMVFSIFENGKDGSLDIATLLRAQDLAFKANGVDLTADELYKIGEDLRTRLDNNAIEPIELSRDMEEAAKEYMDFRTLLAFPEEGYEGMDDEAFMVWKHNVITKAKEVYTERVQKLVAPFIDGELTPESLDKMLHDYTEIQYLRSELASLKPRYDEYLRIETEISQIEKKLLKAQPKKIRESLEERKTQLQRTFEGLKPSKKSYDMKEGEISARMQATETETGIDDAIQKLEQLLVNDYGELLHKSVTDLPETDATDFFAGFGMNVDVSAQRAVLGWNAGLNLPKGHQIDLLLVTTPGESAGFKVGASKEWSELGPDERGKVHVFAHGGLSGRTSGGAVSGSLNVSGGIEYSRLEGGKRESRGTIGAFASAEIGPDGLKATVGVMASIGQLTPEEKEAKYAGELESAREGILKKQYERIDDYVDTVYADKTSKVKQDLKDAIKKSMEDVFLRAVRDAEAGRAAMPKNIELTKFEVGIAVGLDADIKDLGLPVKLHMAAVFSVDGKVFVTRIVTPEHIMDEASDREIMRLLEEDGITAGEMTLTAPLASDMYNMMSAELARDMIERSDDARDILIKVGEGGDLAYDTKGRKGIAFKHSYERSVAMGSLAKAKDALKTDFTNYMKTFREKCASVQIDWVDTGDLHKKRMRIFNTPGITEIHIDPAAEELVRIDDDGYMVFDFASGFPIITKEIFEFESENYGANTVNIITIKFNRHFTRKEIEASEKNYYVMLRNNEDVESKVVEMKPRRVIERDLTMVERAKPKGPKEFFREVEALYARARLIDEGHHKFIVRFGKTEAVDPVYAYISEREVEFIKGAVGAFIPKEQSTRSGEMERRELIEKYFTLSNGMALDEAAGYSRLEPGDQLDLTATQTEETEKLILLIQDWFEGYARKQGWPDTKLNNEQLQYFLGQMVFETFFNIHTGDYEGKTYFIDDSAIFSDAGTDTKPGKREKLRSQSMRSLDGNPVYKTMQNYMAHLHGSGKAMAKNIAVNYVNNHFPRLVGAERDAKIDSLTESIIGDSTNAVYELISEKMNIDFAKAKEYCDYLAYHYFEKNGSPDAIAQAGLSHFSEREREMKEFFGKTETVRAFYETYENIFEGNNIQPRDMDALLLSRLNASFASARHYKHNTDGRPDWYIAGGRAVEALSANFGGLRKTFKYELGDEQTEEEREKARAVFEYMRPLPKLGIEGNEYDPLTNKEFFELGGKDIKYEVEIEESGSDRRIPKKQELETAIRESKEKYDSLEITYEDVKEYLSTPLGLKVLEWAGVFMKEDQADIMFDLFEEVRGQTYDELDKEALLEGDKKAAFVEFVNINRVLREIEYFEANPEIGKEAFYTVGLGGETYEAQIRYIPVENIDSGIRELTEAFTAIQNDADFDKNIEHFLKSFAGMKDDEFANVTDATSFKTNTIAYLEANEKIIGLNKTEVDGLFRGLTRREDVLRQLARVLALSKFTPLSKGEKLALLKDKTSTARIGEIITQENEREYLNQVNSHTMPDGSEKDVIPVAYIFKSSDPNNVMMVNVGGISATGTFLKCGNWSTLAQEQLTLFVQMQRQTVYEGGGAATTRMADPTRPEIDPEYTKISTGIAGSGRVKATPPTTPGTGKANSGTTSGKDTGDPRYSNVDANIDDDGEIDTIDGDETTVRVSTEEIGATTGTMLGTQSPEGISIRRDGEIEPDNGKKPSKPKRKRKDIDPPATDDLDTL